MELKHSPRLIGSTKIPWDVEAGFMLNVEFKPNNNKKTPKSQKQGSTYVKSHSYFIHCSNLRGGRLTCFARRPSAEKWPKNNM